MTTYNKYQQDYYLKHKDDINSRHKEYYQKNKDKWKQYGKENIENKKKIKQSYRRRMVEKVLLDKAKQRAIVKGIECNLLVEDIIIPAYCPYLGIPITNIQGCGRIISNPSIDRIDNSKGYTKDNIRITSLLANIMKHSATEEQLVAFAKGVLRIHDRVTSN